ncbi:MAG: hypothetical protein KDA24_24145 [Deltaproteobacteria bacterium]|nr:hypothetical protein [Deltaproteobacteria bacterium]
MQAPRSWRPTRPEAIATSAAALLALACLAPPVRDGVMEVGYFLLEIVSILLDRPTTLVVGGYVVCTALAAIADVLKPTEGRMRYVAWVPAFLALLGGAYLLALGALLAPGALFVVTVLTLAAFAGSSRIWRRPAEPETGDAGPGVLSALPPVVTLFCVLHLLVEGTAGHILTPYLHGVNALLARFSFSAPFVYDAFVGLLLVGPALLFAPASRLPRLGAAGVGLALLTALPVLPPSAKLFAPAVLLGAAVWLRGDRLLDWLHPDPLRLVHAVAPVMALGLTVVTFHYGTVMWQCDGLEAEGAELVSLSTLDGTFDLEPTLDGELLVVTRREPQEVVVIDLDTRHMVRRTSTALPSDSAFDHNEPETIVATGGSKVLLLRASSDSEEGNRLVGYDAGEGMWTGELEGLGEGVSDLRRDQRGGIWVSTEFRGRIAQVDPDAMTVLSDREVRGAETNAIAVDVDGGRVWSIGLWSDGWLRRVDLRTGQQRASAWVGTRQWDLAWDPNTDRIYIPRLTAGVVEVLDGNSLQRVGGWDVGFGARPIEVSADGRYLYIGNLYTGEVLGWDLTTAENTVRARVGGHIKGLRMGADGTVYTGSNCGVFAIRAGG